MMGTPFHEGTGVPIVSAPVELDVGSGVWVADTVVGVGDGVCVGGGVFVGRGVLVAVDLLIVGAPVEEGCMVGVAVAVGGTSVGTRICVPVKHDESTIVQSVVMNRTF
jgi:hypothetical protein